MNETLEVQKMNIPEEFTEASKKCNGIEIVAESLIVDSPMKFSTGANILGEIKNTRNSIQDVLKTPKKKAKKIHRNYCELEQKYTDPLDHAEELLKSKMCDWVTEQKAVEKEALDSGSSVPSIIPTGDNVSIREIWKYEVVDANKVPKQYMKIDGQMLNGLARSTKGAIEVDGVRFYKSNIIING